MINQEYQRALDSYRHQRKQYYNSLLKNNVIMDRSSKEYRSYMDANRKLLNAIKNKIENAPASRSVRFGGVDDTVFVDEMKTYVTRLNDEHNRSELLLRKHGFLKGNMIVAQRYAESERYKKSIWLVICAIILIITFKTLISPAGATDVFNTILFSIVIFLVVHVTERMGTAPLFLIWLLLVSSISIYMFKHVVDRD